jgi:hypothetical protein
MGHVQVTNQHIKRVGAYKFESIVDIRRYDDLKATIFQNQAESLADGMSSSTSKILGVANISSSAIECSIFASGIGLLQQGFHSFRSIASS